MAGQYQIHNDFLHGSCVDGLLASVCTLKWHDVSWQTLRLKCVIQRFEDIKKLSMSIVCKHSSELEKDVFLSCHESGTRKNSESPWGIEPQTFGILSSDALPLYRLRWVRSIMKFIWHTSCILLVSAMLIA